MQRLHGWIGRKDRQAVAIAAVAHRADGGRTSVKLTNFSDEGCRVELDGMFTIGELIELAIPDLAPMQAQVRWALPGSAGLRFMVEGDF